MSEEFEEVEVYGFKRNIHSVKNYSLFETKSNISYKIIGTFEDGKYFNRFWNYLKLIVLLYSKHGLRKKHLYVVGIDLRMISFFILNSKIDYVISDIVWLYFKGIKKKIFKPIDLFLARTSNKVIFTSLGFYEAYYKNDVPKEKVVLNENLLATYGKVHPLENLRSDGIHIAYIGAFRYGEIIDNLLNAVKKNKQLNLNFYGDGESEIVHTMKEYAEEYDRITYNGAFKNPDDLQAIYEQNNINFVVYDNRLLNERVAMPNKFYESGFFNMPILCATNTYVGQRAVEQGMGWTCDIYEESISEFFDSITISELIDCHNRIKTLDKSQFNY
ncbi:MAG: hypothetical protein WBN56_05040 [Robiginitalea sp.]|uniref:hypothetical protein n=1 Tax=Robiginitalea sp. TaxID=1902411 RepID=UPI003C76EC6B